MEGTKYGLAAHEDSTEYYDPPELLITKVAELAALIRGKKTVVYTGAGLSTSAKIPDYRGPNGVWTLMDRGEAHKIQPINLEACQPTAMHRTGLVDMTVSTNIDGLHRRSGLAESELAELHGNCYREVCTGCKKEFLRDFDVTKQRVALMGQGTHLTSRQCSGGECRAPLRDTIINFGEGLPTAELNKATKAARASQQEGHTALFTVLTPKVSLVLGTSLRVRPACDLPLIPLSEGGHVVICNLQRTPYDPYARLILRARTDDVLLLLAHELGLDPTNGHKDLAFVVPTLEELKARIPKTGRVTGRVAVPASLSLALRPQAPKASKPTEVKDGVIVLRHEAPTLVEIFGARRATYSIEGKTLKIVLNACEDLTLTISGSVLTGTLEIVHCKNLKIVVKTALPTITLDSVEGCAFTFDSKDHFTSMVWADASGVTLSSGEELYNVPRATDLLEGEFDQRCTQCMTYLLYGGFASEPVVREGAGYAVAASVADENKAREGRIEEAMVAAVRSIIKSK